MFASVHPPKKTVIGVLTPRSGGYYYGAVMNGILETVRQRGAIAIAFETARLNLQGGGRVLGANVVHGWLAVNEFEDAALLATLRKSGAPVLHLHSKPDVRGGAVVLPDNAGGAQSLTEHLLGHGHRQVAFAGNLKHVDVAERHAGYRAALEAAGIEVRDELVFDTPHHKEVDGRRVAEVLVQGSPVLESILSGDPDKRVTALVAATDQLAIGALEVLLAAGLRVPKDFALVGFDDADAAQFAEPPLTTVKQSFSQAAVRAVEELLDAITQGRQPASFRVPAQPIIRRSCGCELAQSAPPRASAPPRTRVRSLTEELLSFAGRNHVRDVALKDWPEARKIAELIDAHARGQQASAGGVPAQWWTGFLELKRDAESTVRLLELLESTLRAWSGPRPVGEKSAGILRELRVSLMHQWQRAERIKVAHYESVTESSYKLAHALSSPGVDPSQDLRWIGWGHAHGACFALWAEHAELPGEDGGPTRSDAPVLYITGEYSELGGAQWKGDRRPIGPENFPPGDLLRTAQDAQGIVTIAPVPRARGGEFGLLGVVAPLSFEHLNYVGTPGDWAVQLGAAMDRAETERELRASTELDPLTGLANRATLVHRLDQLASSTPSRPFSVLLIDLDDFKKVNDSLGHEAGDQLLIQIAERLTHEVSASLPGTSADGNLVARVGGDEFVVVLVGVEKEAEAIAVVERVQARLKQPYALHGRTVFVSASIGVNFSGNAEVSAQELLRDADTAMYQAKTRGRARHEIFHRTMHAQALEKLHLDARLRLALEQDELELWYQPIVDLVTEADVGAEALIRWRNPEEGLLTPNRFLPIAEEVGLSIPISEWVIRRACSDTARRRQISGRNLYVNVNVPPDHIKQPGFVEFVQRALEESGLDPEDLGIEVVESTLLDEASRCTEAMTRLRELGVRIAIDDFGTGYSNLSYLRDFPVTTLKIDRDFVKNVPGNARDNGLARAIIAMGEQLGMNIVAEGIETMDQFEFLKRAGCNYGQGYLMSKPLEFPAYLSRLAPGSSPAGPPTSGPRTGRSSDWPDVGMS